MNPIMVDIGVNGYRSLKDKQERMEIGMVSNQS